MIANRRDDSFVLFAGFVDECAPAALHFLFDYPTPRDTMIYQFAIPFIIIECDFAGFQVLFGILAFAPGLATFEFIEFTFGFGVPGIEQLTCVAPLRRAIRSSRPWT